MSANWRYEFTTRATRDLRQLEPSTRRRIVEALDRLAHDPYTGDLRRVQGTDIDEWRLRVGDWRIRFERDLANKTIFVLRILPRGRAYRS